MTAPGDVPADEPTPEHELIDPEKVKITWAGLRATPRYMLKEGRSNFWVGVAEIFFNWW